MWKMISVLWSLNFIYYFFILLQFTTLSQTWKNIVKYNKIETKWNTKFKMEAKRQPITNLQQAICKLTKEYLSVLTKHELTFDISGIYKYCCLVILLNTSSTPAILALILPKLTHFALNVN